MQAVGVKSPAFVGRTPSKGGRLPWNAITPDESRGDSLTVLVASSLCSWQRSPLGVVRGSPRMYGIDPVVL
jgi:hypothetical protein